MALGWKSVVALCCELDIVRVRPGMLTKSVTIHSTSALYKSLFTSGR